MTDRTNQLVDLSAVASLRGRPHGHLEPRGYAGVPSPGVAPPSQAGRFDRMFPFLPAHQEDRGDLERLGDPAPGGSGLMIEQVAVPDSPIPCGFTYLGQFIEHDVSFDPTPLSDQQRDPRALTAFRTPRLNLDSVYHLGPSDSPYLYDRADPDKLLVGPSCASPTFAHATADGAGDLPRNEQGIALIADARNDDNLVVAQLHRVFLKFHNRIVDWLRSHGTAAPLVFTAAQHLARWHYQWVVVHDFLPRVVGPAVVDDVLKHGRRFYRFLHRPFVPIEFSAAAFRFAHAMVRDGYQFHARASARPNPVATLGQLFQFTRTNTAALQWVLHPDDWENFFETNPATAPVHARAIDSRLPATLSHLPGIGPNGGPTSLATRNLLRGLVLGLPSGQSVARHMASKLDHLTPLTTEEIAATDPSGFLATSGLAADTPLWFYLLLEAQLRAGGKHLGPIGGRIVAEVLIGFLQGDAAAYVNLPPAPIVQPPARIRDLGDLVTLGRAEALTVALPAARPLVPPTTIGSPLLRPNVAAVLAGFRRWRPTLPAAVAGQFTMVDLLRFANG